jgi:hypothetical protein
LDSIKAYSVVDHRDKALLATLAYTCRRIGAVVTGVGGCSINPAGAITGSYADASSFYHGFLRGGNGHFTSFDPHGSTGTSPSAINTAGEITGNYTDANGTHGFLRIPAE